MALILPTMIGCSALSFDISIMINAILKRKLVPHFVPSYGLITISHMFSLRLFLKSFLLC